MNIYFLWKIFMGFDIFNFTQFTQITNHHFLKDMLKFDWNRKYFFNWLQKVLWALQTCSRYLSSPNLVLCVSEKIVTVRHTDQITFKEKWEKLQFWKNEAQNILTKPSVLSETFFFSKDCKKFSVDFTDMCKVSERSS